MKVSYAIIIITSFLLFIIIGQFYNPQNDYDKAEMAICWEAFKEGPENRYIKFCMSKTIENKYKLRTDGKDEEILYSLVKVEKDKLRIYQNKFQRFIFYFKDGVNTNIKQEVFRNDSLGIIPFELNFILKP